MTASMIKVSKEKIEVNKKTIEKNKLKQIK